jgi:hypothetical protein
LVWTTVATQQSDTGGSSFCDALELVLDRGMVIDAFARVSLVGVEILKVDVRFSSWPASTFICASPTCSTSSTWAGPAKTPGPPHVVGGC